MIVQCSIIATKQARATSDGENVAAYPLNCLLFFTPNYDQVVRTVGSNIYFTM